MSYNANNDNNQETDRGLKEAFESVQNSFTSEGDHNGVKVLGGLAGVAAVGGLGYVGYNKWLDHNGKEDTEEAKEEFKQNAQAVAVDPANKTATVVSGGGYGNQSGYVPPTGGQGGYGNQSSSSDQQQSKPQEDEDESSHTGLKILGGLAGVAAVSGLGYVGYKKWAEHNEKEDTPATAEEFKQECKPVQVNPQTQTAVVVGDEQAKVSQEYHSEIAAGGYTGAQVNVNGGTGADGVKWQVQYGDKPYPSNAVRGGQEKDGSVLYVARAKHSDGSVQPGKAGPSTGGGCLYAYGGKEVYSSVFEVLIDERNSVRWVGVQGELKPNGTPIEAGKDSDGSVLWVCQIEMSGGCFPGKASPSTGKAMIGWGGVQKKSQDCKILCRA